MRIKKNFRGLSGLTGKGKLKCHHCKSPLSKEPGESFLILRKEDKNGNRVTRHYYICKQCLKQKIVPRCEDKNCKCNTCQDPDLRLKHIHYDHERGGECSCLKCGIVYEEGLLGNGNLGENKSIIKPKEPKDYDILTQTLADDPLVNWFNQTNDELVITCKVEYSYLLSNKYPTADLIFI